MISEYLSEAELYYSSEIKNDTVLVSGDELRHLVNVMRHRLNDPVWVTNGKGQIFKTTIKKINKDSAETEIVELFNYYNEYSHISLCIPNLKNSNRLEFAMEKCTELGITSFIIYSSERTLTKNPKEERWNKIVLSAMKQSLRSFLPVISFKTLTEISQLTGDKILLDQKADLPFTGSLIRKGIDYYLVIGPEGGLSENELNMFNSAAKYKLTPNRLRSETAAIMAVSLLV